MSKNIILLLTTCFISLFLNLLFFVEALNYPTHQLGILREDIIINNDFTGKTLMKLPKGMVIIDTSPQFIATAGMANSDRISFNVVIDKDWIDYSKSSTISPSNSTYRGSIEAE